MESFAQSVTTAATLASAHPIVEATKFPSNGAGWLDWIFGLLQGGYVPIVMHRQHDCYSSSVYALDWFVSTHKVWKYNYGGNDFKAPLFFEASLEPLFALASTADAVMTCLGTSAWWTIAMEEMKEEWEAEKEGGDDDEDVDADADAEEGDEPAEGEPTDEYGEEFRAMLKQYGDEYGDDDAEEEDEAAEEGDADEEGDEDADEDEKKGDKHPGDWLVWWDVGVHGLDLGWSIWKAYDVYGTGVYHYDGGRYLGRMAADTYCILDWILNRKELTPYWNDAMDLYAAAAEAKKAEKESGDDGDDEEDEEDGADEEGEGEEEAEDEAEYGDDY